MLGDVHFDTCGTYTIGGSLLEITELILLLPVLSSSAVGASDCLQCKISVQVTMLHGVHAHRKA